MSLYRSYIPVKLDDKCVISFDVDFTESEATLLGFGLHPSRVNDIESTAKYFIIDNKWLAIDKSTLYKKEGNYILKKVTDNSEFFGYQLYLDIPNKKVYEEVKNPDEFDIKTQQDWLESEGVLYQYRGDKYVYENGVVKLIADSVNITSFYIMTTKGLALEQYLFDSDMQEYNGRFRYVVNNGGSVIDTSRTTENGAYESVATALFQNETNPAYIYLEYQGITPKNFLINYVEA